MSVIKQEADPSIKEEEASENLMCSLYLSHYDAIHSWAFNSLDIVKGQLIPLCFPIFVHCYIDLISKYPEEKESQSQFWNNWQSDFNVNYTDELSSLCTLVTKEQLSSTEYLESHPFIAKAMRLKFVIRLSGIAYSIFTSFIIQNELTIVASIINSKIKFIKEADASPALQVGAYIEFEDPRADSNDQHSTGPSTSTKSVNDTVSLVLGVPGTSSLSANALQYPDTREEAIYRDWFSRICRPNAILKQAAAGTGVKKRVRPEGNATNEVDLDLLRQLGSRLTSSERNSASATAAASANAQEPSVIFATVTNTYEGMVCMHINDDVTQVVTGYRDNMVRVWRLDTETNASHKRGGRNGSSSSGSSGSSGGKGSVGVRVLGESVAPNWGLNEVLPKPKDSYVGNSLHHSQSDNSSNNNGGPMLLELCGHSMPVFGVCQDHTSRLVLSGSGDETIRLWDVTVSSCVGKYTCVSPSWSVQFSPLGYYFASGNQDKTVTVYTTDRIAPLRMLAGHTSDVNAVCWHGNGLLLGSGSDDKTARLWDLRSGGCVRILKGCGGAPISCVSISPSGQLMAGGTENGTICVWDLTTGKDVALLQGHVSESGSGGGVHSLNFSADGSALISGGADCSVRIWDVSVLSAQDTKPGTAHSKLVVRPLSTFYTKFSPVYYVNYTRQNLGFGGGPYSMTAATRHQESHSNSLFASSMSVSEQETVSALRISRAVTSHT